MATKKTSGSKKLVVQNLSRDELNAKAGELEKDLFRLRMERVTGQIKNPSGIWKSRKDLARLKTRLTQLDKASAAQK